MSDTFTLPVGWAIRPCGSSFVVSFQMHSTTVNSVPFPTRAAAEHALQQIVGGEYVPPSPVLLGRHAAVRHSAVRSVDR